MSYIHVKRKSSVLTTQKLKILDCSTVYVSEKGFWIINNFSNNFFLFDPNFIGKKLHDHSVIKFISKIQIDSSIISKTLGSQLPSVNYWMIKKIINK